MHKNTDRLYIKVICLRPHTMRLCETSHTHTHTHTRTLTLTHTHAHTHTHSHSHTHTLCTRTPTRKRTLTLTHMMGMHTHPLAQTPQQLSLHSYQSPGD